MLVGQIASSNDPNQIIICHLLRALEICIFVNERHFNMLADRANCYSTHALPRCSNERNLIRRATRKALMVACIMVIADLSGRISRERSYEISDTNVDRWHASWATADNRESNFRHLLNLLTFRWDSMWWWWSSKSQKLYFADERSVSIQSH